MFTRSCSALDSMHSRRRYDRVPVHTMCIRRRNLKHCISQWRQLWNNTGSITWPHSVELSAALNWKSSMNVNKTKWQGFPTPWFCDHQQDCWFYFYQSSTCTNDDMLNLLVVHVLLQHVNRNRQQRRKRRYWEQQIQFLRHHRAMKMHQYVLLDTEGVPVDQQI